MVRTKPLFTWADLNPVWGAIGFIAVFSIVYALQGRVSRHMDNPGSLLLYGPIYPIQLILGGFYHELDTWGAYRGGDYLRSEFLAGSASYALAVSVYQNLWWLAKGRRSMWTWTLFGFIVLLILLQACLCHSWGRVTSIRG